MVIMKRRLTSWVIRETQIKGTMGCQFIRTRMTRVKKWDKFYEDVEKLQPSHSAGENVNWCSHFGNSSAFPQKLNIELPHHPEIPFVGKCPRDLHTHIHKHTHKKLYNNVLSSITHNSQREAGPPMPINLWTMGKPNVVYPYNRKLLIDKKKWSSDLGCNTC